VGARSGAARLGASVAALRVVSAARCSTPAIVTPLISSSPASRRKSAMMWEPTAEKRLDDAQ
jgi:hypothetical protein